MRSVIGPGVPPNDCPVGHASARHGDEAFMSVLARPTRETVRDRQTIMVAPVERTREVSRVGPSKRTRHWEHPFLIQHVLLDIYEYVIHPMVVSISKKAGFGCMSRNNENRTPYSDSDRSKRGHAERSKPNHRPHADSLPRAYIALPTVVCSSSSHESLAWAHSFTGSDFISSQGRSPS